MLAQNRHYYSLVINYTVRSFAITDGSSHDSAPYVQELKARVMGFIKLSKGPLYWQWIYKIGTCLNSQIIRATVLGGVDVVEVDVAYSALCQFSHQNESIVVLLGIKDHENSLMALFVGEGILISTVSVQV